MRLLIALVEKELGDHGPTLRNAALIVGVASLAFVAFGGAGPGTQTMGCAFAAIVWLAGIATMLLSQDGERGGVTFLARQPVGLAAILAAKFAFGALSGIALLLAPVLAPALVELLGRGSLAQCARELSDLPGLALVALVFASGTLALATILPRGVLALAGGPLLLVPAGLVWNAAGLGMREFLAWTPGLLGLGLAGLAIAAVGFVRGRRLLAPASNALRAALPVALVAVPLLTLPYGFRVAALMSLDPAELVVHGGSVADDGTMARLIVSRRGSRLRLPVRLELASATLCRDGAPLRERHGPPRSGPTLTEHLRRGIEHDNLLRTSRGERFWLEHGEVLVARADGETVRIASGYDWPVAVRGDALLLRAMGLRFGERERCRVVDLVHGEAFVEPLVDPDGFLALEGIWYLADLPRKALAATSPQHWRRYDPKTGESQPLADLPDGSRLIAGLRGARLLALVPKRGLVLLDLQSGRLAQLGELELATLRSGSPGLLADGTQLFWLGDGESRSLTSLGPGATALGPRLELGLVLGACDGSFVLATDPERRRLLRVDVRSGSVEELALRLAEAVR